MPAFARDVFAVGPQGLGLMLTFPALGSVAVGLTLAALRRVSMVRAFLLLALTLAAALVGFCITRSFPVALATLFVVGGCSTGSNTLANTMIQETADEHVRGRVMALFMACTWGMWRLGSLPVGLAAQAWGPPLAVGMAAALLAALLLPLSRSRGLRAAETPRPLVHAGPAELEPAIAGRA
jgi:predicted MFS family arabinose efflux permease